MATITDEFMQEMLAKTKDYCIALLKPGPAFGSAEMPQIIWEHARRNFSLREEGKISVVAPVTSQSDLSGLYIFNVSEDEAKEILDEDPGVKAGVFSFHTYPCKSFPGDSLL